MIVVNCRHLSQRTTGVQRFADGVLSELHKLRDDLKFVAPPKSRPHSEYPVEIVGRGSGHFWEQFELPAYLRGQGSPVLLNLMSTAPVLYSPSVVTHHDITYVRHPESFSLPFRALYGSIVPPSLKRASAIITVSEFSRAEISEHFSIDPSRIHVVGNAPTPKLIADSSSTSSGRFILAVSSPNIHKNFARLIEAFELAQIPDDVELFVVGSAGPAFATHSIDRDSRNVRFLGSVDDFELAKLYRDSIAFCFPSLYEGFGIPPIEAQANGTPVIASNAASIPEVLGDSALFFEPRDVNSIRNAIERVVSDAELQSKLSDLGLRNSSRFSWSISAQRVNRILDGLVS